MDDLRVGRIVRTLRQRLALRQVDVAARVDVGQDVISRIERGRLDATSLRLLRRVLAVFDAELLVLVRWRGGDLDRVLDARHASMSEATLQRLHATGWLVQPEVSYSRFGERGSIDLLAWHPATGTLLVIEIKTELTSVEETLRKHDAKLRLGARIAAERFGWRARRVVRLLVLPEDRTARRRIDAHSGTFARAYPLRGVALRRWLADPAAAGGAGGSEGLPAASRAAAPAPAAASLAAPNGGLLFLPPNDRVGGTQRTGPRRRIRAPTRGAPRPI